MTSRATMSLYSAYSAASAVSNEAAIDAAASGIGITRVFSYQAVDALARGAVVRVLAAYEGEAIPVHLLYPGGAHRPPKLRAFVDYAAPRLRARLDEIAGALR
jgi:DNA-binding transcriptional LysR family regulator